MLSIGLDVHQDCTAVCQLDGRGRLMREWVVRGGIHRVAEHLREIKRPFRVAFEASCGYGVLYDLLSPMAWEVKVAHPTELKLIFRSKHKNDRNDARKIAKLLAMDQIPEVHVPSVDVRAWRGLIEHRRRLVEKRTRVKNSLRAQLRALGIKAPVRRTLWSRKGLEWLQSQDLPTTLDHLKRTSLLAELRTLDEQVRLVERELNALGNKDWRVQLLLSIPGVGPRTAEAVAAYIDVPERFHRVHTIGKYFGVIPSQDASAGKNRLGHITREGPATVRHLVTEAAWRSVRHSPTMKAFYERVKAGQKHRKAVALVATAHKLLRAMLAMLKNRQEWREGLDLPAFASANCIQTKEPCRHERGKVSMASQEPR
jgi:transposase